MDDMKDMLEGPCGATVPTKWYIALFKVVEGFARTRAKAESELYPEKGAWGSVEVAGNILADVMVPKEKCRIVIDYDPAAERVKIGQWFNRGQWLDAKTSDSSSEK